MKDCYKNILLVFLLLIFAIPVIAKKSVPETITTISCKDYTNSTAPFMLVLHEGEKIIESINKCAKEANLTAASVSGLGLLKSPELSYFNQETKKLDKKIFPGVYELVVLNGSISKAPGRSYADIHAVISDDQYNSLAGHLEEATVLLRVDIIFTPLKRNGLLMEA